MSEEGIAKGVRRIVAVTADDAAAAIAEGDKLVDQVEKAAALPDAELEQVRHGWLTAPLMNRRHCITRYCIPAAQSSRQRRCQHGGPSRNVKISDSQRQCQHEGPSRNMYEVIIKAVPIIVVG